MTISWLVESSKSEAPKPTCTILHRIPEWTKPPERVVSFERRSGWLELPESLVAQTSLLHLFFQFRTLESTGLILYAAGISRDFFDLPSVDCPLPGVRHYEPTTEWVGIAGPPGQGFRRENPLRGNHFR